MDNENKMRVFHLEEMVIGKICKYHKSFHIFACNVIHFLVLICDIYFCVNIIYVSYYHNKQSIEANFFHVRFELYFCGKICNKLISIFGMEYQITPSMFVIDVIFNVITDL